MLPAGGYFKDIDCPYYDNFCGRPYCHFRHRKRNQDSTEEHLESDMLDTGIPTYQPTPKSQLEKTKSHIPISYVPDTVIRPERINRIYNYAEKITYKPTPLSELSKTNTATINELNKDLFSITNKNDEETVSSDNEVKDSAGDCDINFEELSTEMDMIDDIINENLDNEDNHEHVEEEIIKEKENVKKEEKCDKNNKSSSSKSSKRSSSNAKSSSSKNKNEKTSSKHSSAKSSSSSNHKHSSHKSKSSDRHRSHSRDKSKEKSSDSKQKDDKKRDKDRDKDRDKEKDRDKDRNRNKEKDSKEKEKEKHKSSSRHNKNKEKHKDKDAKSSKRKESKLRNSKEKSHKESKSTSEEETSTSKYVIKDISDNEDNGYEDLFDEDLEEECYRIFNEYKPEVVSKPEAMEVENLEGAVEEYVPTSKKRVAHMGADQYVPKLSYTKSKSVQNAALQMTNRYKIARDAKTAEDNDIVAALNKHGTKRHNLILETYQKLKKSRFKEPIKDNVEISPPIQSTSIIDDIINGKPNPTEVTYKPTPISKLNSEDGKLKPKRIAPAMNVSSIQQAKAKLAELAKKKDSVTKTPIQTLGKGNKRVAHIPDTSLGELPDVLQADSKKIAVNVRTRYLTMLADECVKLYLSREEAYNRALNEEVKVMERCAAIVTYRNSAMLAVNRIRKELQERLSKGLGPIAPGESTTSNADNQFRGKRFHDNILQYTMKENELDEQGYPREGPIAGKAVIKVQKQLPRVNLDENQRLCCRCFKVYLVDDRGFPIYEDECLYHPLKKRTLKGDRIYLCCKSSEDTGCMTSSTHVCETEDADLLGYQMTMDPERDDDSRSSAVYALDCEMCYTTKGLELTRVTIIDPDCKTVYDTLVKPLNPITDYNTQFSGITKEQMDRTSTNILQVQANILHLCNSETILIGHSLESDLKALKIIHSSVIDTAMLFPHRMGLPHKRALRVLASEYLRKIIQSDVGGHDSGEDAITCMELVMWRLKEDLKVKGSK